MNQHYVRLLASASLILSLSVAPGRAQNTSPRTSAPAAATSGGRLVPSEYALGPGDEITINALEAEEISGKPMLIGSSGNIEVPLLGRMHAAGLTVEQL